MEYDLNYARYAQILSSSIIAKKDTFIFHTDKYEDALRYWEPERIGRYFIAICQWQSSGGQQPVIVDTDVVELFNSTIRQFKKDTQNYILTITKRTVAGLINKLAQRGIKGGTNEFFNELERLVKESADSFRYEQEQSASYVGHMTSYDGHTMADNVNVPDSESEYVNNENTGEGGDHNCFQETKPPVDFSDISFDEEAL